MARELVEDLQYLGSVFQGMQNNYLDQDYTEILTDFADDLSEDHQGYFDAETAPTGEPWQPLAASTIARKGHDTILVETGNLQESLRTGHSDNIFEIDANGSGEWNLAWGTADEKAGFHMFGGGNVPARPMVGVTEERADALANLITDDVVESLKL